MGLVFHPDYLHRCERDYSEEESKRGSRLLEENMFPISYFLKKTFEKLEKDIQQKVMISRGVWESLGFLAFFLSHF